MHKTYLTYSVVLLIISISLAIGSRLWLNRIEYKNINNQQDCENVLNPKDNLCGIWYGNICRKGKLNGVSCVSQGSIVPLVLLSLCILTFIVCLTFFILSLKR